MDQLLCEENLHRLNELASEVARETGANERDHESFRRRLSDLEENGRRQTEILVTLQRQADAIESINSKVDNVVDTMGKVATSVDHVDARVTKIEHEPGEKWKKITFEIIKGIVLAIVGAAIAYFGLKM